jgi:hypothetical protein
LSQAFVCSHAQNIIRKLMSQYICMLQKRCKKLHGQKVQVKAFLDNTVVRQEARLAQLEADSSEAIRVGFLADAADMIRAQVCYAILKFPAPAESDGTIPWDHGRTESDREELP